MAELELAYWCLRRRLSYECAVCFVALYNFCTTATRNSDDTACFESVSESF